MDCLFEFGSTPASSKVGSSALINHSVIIIMGLSNLRLSCRSQNTSTLNCHFAVTTYQESRSGAITTSRLARYGICRVNKLKPSQVIGDGYCHCCQERYLLYGRY